MQKTKLGTFSVYFENQEEYHVIKNEIFTEDLYYFESDKPDPVILDIGANIGLATLYFKKHYPQAKITAVEPIFNNFKLLEQNIFENNLVDTNALQVAVTPLAGSVTLHTDQFNNWHSTAGIIEGNWTKSQATVPKVVEGVTLSSLINEPIDLIKMDIEGAEQAVLIEALPKLNLVRQILCEFHPIAEQNISDLVKQLEKTGFKVELLKKGHPIPLKKATGMVLINAYQANKG
jgi:FkbM family methyltransferase